MDQTIVDRDKFQIIINDRSVLFRVSVIVECNQLQTGEYTIYKSDHYTLTALHDMLVNHSGCVIVDQMQLTMDTGYLRLRVGSAYKYIAMYWVELDVDEYDGLVGAIKGLVDG